MFIEMGIDLEIDFDFNSQKWQSFNIKGMECEISTMHSNETMAKNLNILTRNETIVNVLTLRIQKCIKIS